MLKLKSNALINSYGKYPDDYDLMFIHFGFENYDDSTIEKNNIIEDLTNIKSYIKDDRFKIYFSNIDSFNKNIEYLESFIDNIYLRINSFDDISNLKKNSVKLVISINELESLNVSNDIILQINNINELDSERLDELKKKYNIVGISYGQVSVAEPGIWEDYLNREKDRLNINSNNYSDIEKMLVLSNDIYSVDTYKEILKKTNEIFDNIGIENNMSEKEKFDRIYDYIINNFSYAYDTLDDNLVENQTLIGGLFNNKCVCEGYTKVLNLLLNKANIESITVGGGGSKKDDGHLWNQVKIDNVWYNADATVDSIRLKEGNEEALRLVSDDKLLYKTNYLTSHKCLNDYEDKYLDNKIIKNRKV